MTKSEVWMKYKHGMIEAINSKLTKDERLFIDSASREMNETAYQKGYLHGSLCVFFGLVMAAVLLGLGFKYGWF